MTQAIVDTGPLVAFLAESDSSHAWATSTLAGLEPPFLTCDVVIAEAHYLLAQTRSGADGLLALLEVGALRSVSLAELDTTVLRKLIDRYKNVPMDLADASVVRLSEIHPAAKVVTIDSDFRIYRRNGRQAIPILSPPLR